MRADESKITVLAIIKNPVGGIRTYIKYTYGLLDKRKFRFIILLLKEEAKDSEYIEGDLRGFDKDIIKVKARRLGLLLLLYNIYKAIRRYEIDVIHSHGLTSGALAVLGNLFFRRPHIVTSHDVFRHDQFKAPFGGIKKAFFEKLLGLATVIQSVSYDAQDNLIRFLPSLGKRRERLIVISNGIMVESSAEGKEEDHGWLRKKLDIGQEMIAFGFLGRFMPQKGFVYLIEAVEQLKAFGNRLQPFKVIAFGDGDYIREYKKLIEQKKLSDRFIFYGFVPSVAKIYSELDCVIMPSLWEAFGLVAVESLVAGCPVIATDCIGLREVLRGTPAIIVRKKSGGELASGMRKLIGNLERVKSETSEFIPIAKRRFSAENTARELGQLIQKVVLKRT